MLSVGVFGGVVEQFSEREHQVEVVGVHLQLVGNFRLKPHVGMWELFMYEVDALTGFFVACHRFFGEVFGLVGSLGLGAVVEHEHHAVQRDGVVLHLVGNGGQFVVGQSAKAAVEHGVGTPLDDVQRPPHLVQHVADELVLLLYGLLGLLHLLNLLHVVFLYLAGSLSDASHLRHDGPLHGGKAVLQLCHSVVVV